MNYETIDYHTFQQCTHVRLKVKMIGVHLEKGDEVLVYHKFRIFKPEVKAKLGAQDKFIAFDVDGQLFDNFFEVVKPSSVEQVRIDAQKVEAARKAQAGS